jgi:membrane fusion protein, copper/silver efflux system
MKRPLNIALLLLLLIVSFMGGSWYNQHKTGKEENNEGSRKVLYYVDPMNPAHTSDKPGAAPCGMPMEPVHADDGDGGAGGLDRAMPPGTARITPEKQQVMGIQLGKVEAASFDHPLRTLGKVAADENRTYRLLAGADGWVWKVRESTTGSLVSKDQLLATVYNYEFLAREQQYLYAMDFAERKQQSGGQSSPAPRPGEVRSMGSLPPGEMVQKMEPVTNGLNPFANLYYINDPVELAKLELYNLGVGDYQLQELARTREVTTELDVRAPVTGIVIARNVSPMQKFVKGSELFQIADLARVWIVADVFENESRHVRPGMAARVFLPHQERAFEAKVTEVPPRFEDSTRTLKVRLEVDNPDMELRPDMFVDVELLISLPASINVPAEAVLDSGLRKTVFVDRGNGFFEPRRVKIGWRFGDRVQILDGLMAGEVIVTAGNFLIDSESRMRLAAAGLYGASHKDPVCGMEVLGGKARAEGLTVEHGGKTHYFCSKECKHEFLESSGLGKEQAPGGEMEHAVPPAAGRTAPKVAGMSLDPVCGVSTHEGNAKAAGLVGEYGGKTYYFCSRACMRNFIDFPDRYAEAAARREKQQSAAMLAPAPAPAPAAPPAGRKSTPLPSEGGHHH